VAKNFGQCLGDQTIHTPVSADVTNDI